MVSSKGSKTPLLQRLWSSTTVAVVFILFCLASSSALAACHAVSQSGAGSQTGADWNNSLAGLPGSFVRGDIYYLADGTYSGFTFSTATSGSLTVEIRKAQSYDNGSSCPTSIAAGWNTSTMGSSQAVFKNSSITVNSSYFTLNGNGKTTAAGCGGAPGSTVSSEPPTPSDCGISLNNFGGSQSILLYNESGSNLNYNYLEVFGSGSNTGDQHEIFGPLGTSGSNNYSHLYAHYAGCVFMQDLGSGSTVDHSYFWGTEVNGGSSCHGQAEFEIGGTNNGVRSNNVYQDITGTAVWTFAASVGTNNNWNFYNNVVFFSSPQLSFGGLTDAALDCINGNLCTNFTYVHNTIVNCLSSGVFGQSECGIGFADGASGCSLVAENNLYAQNQSNSLISLTRCGSMTLTEDYNSFVNSPTFGSGSHDVHVASGATNPFVNWSASNFSLSSDNSDWNNRLALGSPYTVDVTGTTFTTDRGAYQFSTGGSGAPTPPSGLTASVSP